MENQRFEIRAKGKPGLTCGTKELAMAALDFYCDTFEVERSAVSLSILSASVVKRELADPTGREPVSLARASRAAGTISLDENIAIIRDWVHTEISKEKAKPLDCPICGTQLKIYRRKLNSGIARGVLLMYRFHRENPETPWIHISKESIPLGLCMLFHHFEHEKLPFWGLAEKREERDDSRKVKGGFWRLTKKGIDFAENKGTTWSHVIMYLNQCIGESDKSITITEALGHHFNYFELMSASLSDLVADQAGNVEGSKFVNTED